LALKVNEIKPASLARFKYDLLIIQKVLTFLGHSMLRIGISVSMHEWVLRIWIPGHRRQQSWATGTCSSPPLENVKG